MPISSHVIETLIIMLSLYFLIALKNFDIYFFILVFAFFVLSKIKITAFFDDKTISFLIMPRFLQNIIYFCKQFRFLSFRLPYCMKLL